MKMWEIRERDRHRMTYPNAMEPDTDELYEEAYEKGFEEGYRQGKEEIRPHVGYRRR